MLNDGCCKDCVAPERHVGCRAECPKWAENEERKRKKQAEMEAQRAGTYHRARKEECYAKKLRQKNRVRRQ